MKVYAYYRVSTNEQDYKPQQFGVLQYCACNNLIIDKEIVDDGISGTVPVAKRNLGKLVKLAKKGDWIITSELSRFGRSTADVIRTCETLTANGVNVYFIKQNMKLDNTPMGRLMVSIFGAFAQLERDLISQRTREALAMKKAQGVKLGRQVGSKNKFHKSDLLEQQFHDFMYWQTTNSLRDLSKRYKMSTTTIMKWMRENGIDRRDWKFYGKK